MKEGFDQVQVEFKRLEAYIKDVDARMKGGFEQISLEMKKLDAHIKDVDARIKDVEFELKTEIKRVESDLTLAMKAMELRLTEKMGRMIFGSTAFTITVLGAFITLAKFF